MDQLTHLKQVHDLAIRLMEQHGLKPDQPGGWKFRWDRAKKRAGNTNFTRKTISFSPLLHALWTLEQSRDIILHEIAHALAGPKTHHSDVWKGKAVEVGANPECCYDSATHAPVPGRYEGTCPNGHKIQVHRRLKNMNRRSCKKCSRVFDERYLITWREAI